MASLSKPAHRKFLEEVVSQLLGSQRVVNCQKLPPPEPQELPPEAIFESNFDDLIGSFASIFAHRGNAAAVAVLSEAKVTLEEKGCDHDGDRWYDAWLFVPQVVFNSVADRIGELENELRDGFGILVRPYYGVCFDKFIIQPKNKHDPDWRGKAKAWLKGAGVTNQGRVRSDNIAPYEKDGLLFRSKAEINLYDALKSRGITFAPLPVFLRGGDTYRRIEPDFVIFQSGKVIVVELHGLPFHHETPVEAHERTTMFYWEKAHVEPIDASECDTPEKALRVASQIQALIRKLLGNK